jgi:hypothetical protein
MVIPIPFLSPPTGEIPTVQSPDNGTHLPIVSADFFTNFTQKQHNRFIGSKEDLRGASKIKKERKKERKKESIFILFTPNNNK